MTNEKKMTQETVRAPQRVPGFDPMQFVQEVAGKKILALKYKRAWFRAACPSGGVVLNPLRVTDQMAIFEARLFADTEDRNPLASFTAARAADKATGKQYIQAAQEDALNEALENAGFGLPLIPMAAPVDQVEIVKEAAGGGQSEETSAAPVTESQRSDEPTVTAAEKAPSAQQPKSEGKAAPRPAPAGPQPHAGEAPRPTPTAPQSRAAETPRPAPVGPQPRTVEAPRPAPAAPQPQFQRVTETNSPASAVVDISTAKPAGEAATSAAQPASGADAPAQAAPAPVAYNADMTVEEITRLMTLEQAKQIKVQDGTCRGWTLEQVAADRPPSLKWLKYTAPFADNVMKAAAGIVLADLELKKAG